ncbi:MAG: AI-2E family transporter, partial [Hyphomicrobiales bacterium]|nr:AI-2E family transporter [Hyphomicrobiales bacterium]
MIRPLIIAAFFAYILNPAVTLVDARTKLNRQWAVILVFLAAITVVVITAIILVPIVPNQLVELASQLESITARLEQNLATPLTIFGFQIPLDNLLGEHPLTIDFIRPDLILDFLRATTTNLVWMLVGTVTTYYLLQDWPRLRDWLLLQAPDEYEPDAGHLYYEVRDVWQRYLSGQVRLMTLIGFITGLVAAVIGLPAAWAFGFLAALFDIVPSVGPTVVTVIATAVAFFTGSTYLDMSAPWFALVVLITFSSIHVVENIWLRPKIMGDKLHLHPALILVGVLGALELAGALTALVIVPAMGSVSVIGRYLYCKILNIEPRWKVLPPQRTKQE